MAKWLEWLKNLIILIVFSYIVILGANAISEIQERNLIHKEIERQIVDLVPDDPTKQNFNKLLLKLKGLIAAGALNEQMTLLYIKAELYGITVSTNYIKDTFPYVGKVLMPDFIDASPSMRMYAFLIIFASVIGSFVNYQIRSDKDIVKSLITGVGAGVVSYLAIDGGALNQVVSGVDKESSITTGVLIGFLAGTFSDYVYSALDKMMDRLLRSQ